MPCFAVVADDPDMEYAIVDATIAKVHRHGRGAKRGTLSQAIGSFKGGLTTKILALVDALGNLARFVLLPAHRHDGVGVASLLDGLPFGALLNDSAFDSNGVLANLDARGEGAVIAQHQSR